jgi:sugar lactone lactonase YvrE
MRRQHGERKHVAGSRRITARAIVAVAAVCALTFVAAGPASAATEDIPPTTSSFVENPAGVAVDSTGETYVVSSFTKAVDVFDLAGDLIRSVSGAQTQLNAPIGVTVDANRYLYVANNAAPNTILVFAPGASGDAAPVRVISGTDTGLAGVRGLAVDAAGYLYAANFATFGGTVTVYAPGASGDAAPVRTISGGSTGLSGAYDVDLRNGLLYVANLNANSITEYDANADGDQAPLHTIAGADTGLASPMGVGVDEFGNVYAGNYAASSVTVYGPSADGDSTPTRVLTGPSTGIVGPGGLAVDDAGTIFVSNASGWTMTSYATAPTIAGISVSTGPTSGGTQIEVTGTGFSAGLTAAVGGAPVGVHVIDSTHIQLTTAAHAAGAADVAVTTRGGVATLSGAFTFVTPPPAGPPPAKPVDPAELAATGGSFGGPAALSAGLMLSGGLLLIGRRRLRGAAGRRRSAR